MCDVNRLDTSMSAMGIIKLMAQEPSFEVKTRMTVHSKRKQLQERESHAFL